MRAALRMQETLALTSAELGVDIRMRVGVNTGEVLVGALRAGGDYTAMGDVVNTANRLQSAAQPGRGDRRPGHVRRDRARSSATSRSSRSTPRVARSSSPAWRGRGRGRAARATGRSATGPDSSGASPSWACCATASRTPIRNARGALLLLLRRGRRRASPGSAEELASHAECEHNALDPRGALRALRRGQRLVAGRRRPPPRRAASGRATPPTRPCEMTRTAVCIALGEGANPAEVERVYQGLLYLMGYDSELRGIDPARARDEATSAVVTYVERYSLHRPVVVVLSDLHWADDLVLELVDTLLDRLSSRRFVVLATARQVVEDRWHPPHGRHNLVVVTLDPLTGRRARELLLEELAGRELGTELSQRAARPQRRQPLLPRGARHAAGRRGHGRRRRARPPSRRPAWSSCPTPSAAWWRPASTGSPSDERRVLDDCAVLGRRGPMMAIEVMAGKHLGIDNVRPVLESLEAKELLVAQRERRRGEVDVPLRPRP